MASKRGLGKGLSALLPAEPEEPRKDNVREAAGAAVPPASPAADAPQGMPLEAPQGLLPAAPRGMLFPDDSQAALRPSAELLIPVDALKPNPNQPRTNFNEEELVELAESIKQQGIIQPIIAEENGDGTYTIIAGERRTRAARLAGLESVPVILRKYSEERQMEVALIENIQRSALNPIEEAQGIKRLMEHSGLSQDEAAAKLGKNRATVANVLRLLKLPKEMRESIAAGELTPGHGRAILSLSDAKGQATLFHEIISRGLSVREAEKRAAALGKGVKPPPKPTPAATAAASGRAPELTAMEEKFITTLGTKVRIDGSLDKGCIIIDYYSMDDLDRLYEILNP